MAEEPHKHAGVKSDKKGRWDLDEHQQLIDLLGSSMTMDQISILLGRSVAGIRAQMSVLVAREHDAGKKPAEIAKKLGLSLNDVQCIMEKNGATADDRLTVMAQKIVRLETIVASLLCLLEDKERLR